MSLVKLGGVCRFGFSGGARFGTAGGTGSMEGFDFEISTAVVGLSSVGSACSLASNVGRLSDDLNFDDRFLADIDSLPLDLGGAGVSEVGGVVCGSSSSSGEVANEDVIMLPDEGNLGLCPKVVDPPLGFVRCDRKETDRLTLYPRSDTLEVKDNILLSRLCPLMNLLLSLSAGISSGGLNLPFAPSSGLIAGSFATVCFFPVNRPNTLVEVVVKEGILTASCSAYTLKVPCGLSPGRAGASTAGLETPLALARRDGW